MLSVLYIDISVGPKGGKGEKGYKNMIEACTHDLLKLMTGCMGEQGLKGDKGDIGPPGNEFMGMKGKKVYIQ